MHEHRTHYDTLEISRNAGPEKVRAAYYWFAKKYHRNSTHPGATPNDTRFMAAQNAYEVLFDTERRALYDQTLPAEDTETASGTGATETTAASDTTDTTSTSGTKSSTSGSRSGNSGVHTAPYPKTERQEKKDFNNHGHHPGPKYSYKSRHYPLTRASQPSGKYAPLWSLHAKPKPVFESLRPASPEYQSLRVLHARAVFSVRATRPAPRPHRSRLRFMQPGL